MEITISFARYLTGHWVLTFSSKDGRVEHHGYFVSLNAAVKYFSEELA